jgi:hypothetical protein
VIVPKVSPVDMSRVVKTARGAVYRRASGKAPASFGTILPTKRSARMPRLPQSAPVETFIPPFKKKKG